MSVVDKIGPQSMEFDKEVYKRQIIEEGIADFAHIARIMMKDGGKNWIVTVDALDETESSYKMMNEFGNYVLAKEINS